VFYFLKAKNESIDEKEEGLGLRVQGNFIAALNPCRRVRVFFYSHLLIVMIYQPGRTFMDGWKLRFRKMTDSPTNLRPESNSSYSF
jgi:hypothetical protein